MSARRFDLEAAKAALPLSQLIGASLEWDMRKSQPSRGDYWALCPFHEERSPSFHVRDRTGGYYCFGCGARGDHVTWLTDGLGAPDFLTAAKRLVEIAGAGGPTDAKLISARDDSRRRQLEAEAERDAAHGFRQAREIWEASQPRHAVLSAYLRARGVDVDAVEAVLGGLPAALRVHLNLPCYDNGRLIHQGPAMVARVGRGDAVGIHRTWIDWGGRARLPDGSKVKKSWRGRTGAMFGQPVVLAEGGGRILVGEGIETVLALWSALLARGEVWSAEAALSRDALCGRGDPRFAGPGRDAAGHLLPSPVPDYQSPGWLAPEDCAEVVVLAEGSAKAPRVAERLTARAVKRHAYRQDGSARRSSYRLPGGRWDLDMDFADLAQGQPEAPQEAMT